MFPRNAHDSTLLGGEAKWKRSGTAEYMVYRQMAWYWNTADAYKLAALVKHVEAAKPQRGVPNSHIDIFCGKKNGCKMVVAGAEGGLHFLVPVKQNSMDGMVVS